MPIDPGTVALISSLLGFTGGLFGGDEDTQQKRRSFTESPVTDPRQVLSEAILNTRNMGGALAEKVRKPIQLKSRAVSSVGRPSSIDPASFATEGLNLGPMFGSPVQSGPRTGSPQDPNRAVDADGNPVRRRPTQRESRRDMI